MRRVFSLMQPAAIVFATLGAVAAVCSHNHAHAPLAAAAFIVTAATFAMLHRRAAAKH